MSSDSETDNKEDLKKEVTSNDVSTNDFKNIMININTKYISFIQELNEKFKYHDELSGQFESDIKSLKKNMDNEYYLLYFLTINISIIVAGMKEGMYLIGQCCPHPWAAS